MNPIQVKRFSWDEEGTTLSSGEEVVGYLITRDAWSSIDSGDLGEILKWQAARTCEILGVLIELLPPEKFSEFCEKMNLRSLSDDNTQSVADNGPSSGDPDRT